MLHVRRDFEFSEPNSSFLARRDFFRQVVPTDYAPPTPPTNLKPKMGRTPNPVSSAGQSSIKGFLRVSPDADRKEAAAIANKIAYRAPPPPNPNPGPSAPQSRGTKRKGQKTTASSSPGAKKPKCETTPKPPPEIICISSDDDEDQQDQQAGAPTLAQQPPVLPRLTTTVTVCEPMAQIHSTLATTAVVDGEVMEQLHELDYIPLSSPVSESEDGPSFAPADAAEAGGAPQTISNPSAGARRDPQLRLSEEQQKVVDLAAKGHNIFYTGSAGCGKSTVLHAIKRQLRDMGKHVKVMAPTGIAALAIGGETWWRFAGLGPDRLKMSIQKHFSSMASTTQKKLRNRMEKVDVIIIDEVSMVESNNFDRLNRLVKLARRDPNRAFGGLQVIVTGDFCQLPPVKPFEFCLDCGNKMQQGHNGEETTYYCANIKDCPRLRDPFHVESPPWCEDCGDEMQRGGDTKTYDFRPKPTFRCPTCPDSFVEFSPCCNVCGQELVRGRDNTAGELMYQCPQCPTFLESQKWAFCSEAWKECNFEHIHLNGIHRQHDPEFISMLQKCRIGEALSEGETDRLMVHESVSTNAITLFSTRKEVDNKNDQCFRALKTDPHEYKSFDDFWWNDDRSCQKDGDKNPVDSDGWESLNALNEHRYPETVTLKTGMPVVLLANLDVAAGLCNGSQGMICRFEPYDPAKLPKRSNSEAAQPNGPPALMGEHAERREEHIQIFCKQEEDRLRRRHNRISKARNAGWRNVEEQVAANLMFPVIRWLRKTTPKCVIYPDCQVSERGEPINRAYSLLSRTQVPLAPAWALTIHKAQGMTLDRVIVDLSRAFEEGQVYVALSRATSLKGLTLRGSREGLKVGLGGNKEVREFLRNYFGI